MMTKTENTSQAKELLKKVNDLISEESTTMEYNHTAEITNISRKLQSMKLKDEFHICDLSKDEFDIFNLALIIANASK